MNDNPSGRATLLDEELVAYLDGELDAESARRIEGLLASDPEVRRRLQSFERAWELLDELEAAPAGEPFTRTTLEMVAVAARQDAERDEAEAPRRRRRWLLLVGVSLLAAAAVGFLAVALYDPDRQLLRDLPLLENLDEYRQVASIDFLHGLRDEKLFSKDGGEPPKSETADEEDVPSRRQRIRNMSLDEKEQLLRSEDRFENLTLDEQRQVRRLHEDLQRDDDREQLRAIMHNYCEWLKPLSPLSWAELSEMAPRQRVAQVKKWLREEQQREGARRPGHRDMEAIARWMNGCAMRHEAALVASLPKAQREQFSKSSKSEQRQTLFWQLWLQWQTPVAGKLPPMVAEEDVAALRAKLTPQARKRLEGKPSFEQCQLVIGWLRQGPWHPEDDWRLHGRLPKNDDDYWAEYFETGLRPEERDRLLAMPGEEIQWRLREMHWMRMRPPEGPGRPPGHIRRPGDPEPPRPWKDGRAPPMSPPG
jgi:hypothetical protein